MPFFKSSKVAPERAGKTSTSAPQLNTINTANTNTNTTNTTNTNTTNVDDADDATSIVQKITDLDMSTFYNPTVVTHLDKLIDAHCPSAPQLPKSLNIPFPTSTLSAQTQPKGLMYDLSLPKVAQINPVQSTILPNVPELTFTTGKSPIPRRSLLHPAHNTHKTTAVPKKLDTIINILDSQSKLDTINRTQSKGIDSPAHKDKVTKSKITPRSKGRIEYSK